MPKKPTTAREEMIEGAFQLIRKNGHEAFSARNLASFLGCSTQPVMYQFPNLEELKELAYRRADGFHTDYIMSGGSLPDIGLRYIRFAAEEPFLFRFLFQSGRFSGLTLEDLIRAPEVAPILEVASDEEGLTMDEAIAYFEPLCVAVHGYASLIANNGMDYDPVAIEKSLTALAEAVIGKDEKMKVILYDLDSRYDEMIKSKCDHALAADGKYAPCQGCFGCWTKHPAECFMKDKLQQVCRIIGQADHERILCQLKDAQAVVFCLPLYVDGIPSHVLHFMEEMEPFCRKNSIHINPLLHRE